tara:strand:+ start:166 stop:450 length:285 start_codon:yes stop_codon:yes gene_type:complete
MNSSDFLELNQTLQDSTSVKKDNLNSIKDGQALFSVDPFLTQQESMQEKETERILCCKTSSKLTLIKFMEEVSTFSKRSSNTLRIQVGSSTFIS